VPSPKLVPIELTEDELLVLSAWARRRVSLWTRSTIEASAFFDG
jgi:hypothetical protein